MLARLLICHASCSQEEPCALAQAHHISSGTGGNSKALQRDRLVPGACLAFTWSHLSGASPSLPTSSAFHSSLQDQEAVPRCLQSSRSLPVPQNSPGTAAVVSKATQPGAIDSPAVLCSAAGKWTAPGWAHVAALSTQKLQRRLQLHSQGANIHLLLRAQQQVSGGSWRGSWTLLCSTRCDFLHFLHSGLGLTCILQQLQRNLQEHQLVHGSSAADPCSAAENALVPGQPLAAGRQQQERCQREAVMNECQHGAVWP